MKASEIAQILAEAAKFDKRKTSHEDVEAWQASKLGRYDWDVEDCLQAVADHYSDSTDFLMPKHVIDRVANIRAARIAKLERVKRIALEDIGGDSEYGSKLRELVADLARRRLSPEHELETGGFDEESGDQELSEVALEAMARMRGVDREFLRARHRSLRVECPTCGAGKHRACFNPVTGELLDLVPAHRARLERAGVVTPPSEEAREDMLRRMEARIAEEEARRGHP